MSLVFMVVVSGTQCKSTVCTGARVLAQSAIARPVGFLVSNRFAANIAGYPGPKPVTQAAPQTRPRRVNPDDPAIQPSPMPRNKTDGARGSSELRRPARPDPPNSRLPAKSRSPAPASPSYTIQVGAFLQIGNARRLAQTVSKKGYSARVISLNDSHGKKWQCVRVGNYPNRDGALKTAGEIEAKLKLKPIVRSSGSL